MKSLETIAKLARIVSLIRDPDFIATQPSIATDLGCCDRQVRTYFEVLVALNAPLINHGRMGWELESGWDLWVALRKYCEKF